MSPRVTWPSRLSPVPHTSGYNFTEATAHAQNTTLSPPNSNPNPNPDADQDTPAPQAVRPPPRAASPGSVLGLGPHVIARRPPVALCRIIIAFAPKGLCAANARSLARSIESLSCAGMVNTVKAPPAQPATRRSDLHCTCCGGALAPHASTEVTARAHIAPGKTWMPLNVRIDANDRGDSPSSYRAWHWSPRDVSRYHLKHARWQPLAGTCS